MWLMTLIKVILDNPQTSPTNRRFEWFASVHHLSNRGKPALLITSKKSRFLFSPLLIRHYLNTLPSKNHFSLVLFISFVYWLLDFPYTGPTGKWKSWHSLISFFSLSSLSLFPYSLHWHTRKTTTNWMQIHTKNLNHILTPLSSQKGMFVSNNKKSTKKTLIHNPEICSSFLELLFSWHYWCSGFWNHN